MDSAFDATCQGIGLALAAGLLGGALGQPSRLSQLVGALAAAGGAALFWVSLDDSHHTAWPGIPAGVALALLAYVVARDVVVGASKRTESGGTTIPGIVVLFAFVLAGLTLLIEPVALVALAGVLYLALARRSRSRRKYEGLRVLR
jgi:hypothetical protein